MHRYAGSVRADQSAGWRPRGRVSVVLVVRRSSWCAARLPNVRWRSGAPDESDMSCPGMNRLSFEPLSLRRTLRRPTYGRIGSTKS